MVDERFRAWIERQKKKGYTEHQLDLYLNSRRYSKEDIDSKTNFSRPILPKALLIGVGLTLLVIISFFITQKFNDEDYPEATEAPEFYKFLDPQVCEEEDQARKDKCFLSIAKAQSNLEICEKIVDNFFKNECYVELAIIKKSQKICDIVDDKFVKDECYLVLAMERQNERICKNIVNEEMKADCFNLF